MKMLKTYLFCALVLVFIFTSCESPIEADSIKNTNNLSAKSTPKIPVWAGGVPQFESFIDPNNSKKFRDRGGKLWVHHLAWDTKLGSGATEISNRSKILQNFTKSGLFLEIGYTGEATGPNSWPVRYDSFGYNKNNYWSPAAITANIFAGNNKPVAKSWKFFVDEMKKSSNVTNIYPTWEYQNLHDNRKNDTNLDKGLLSKNKNFQDIVKYSKGMTFDVPPNLFFDNKRVNHSYRAYIKDAIEWIKSSKCNDCKVYLILSANNGKNTFSKDCIEMYKHLKNNNILPDGFIVNNYTLGNAGPETEENSALHAALNLMNIIGEK